MNNDTMNFIVATMPLIVLLGGCLLGALINGWYAINPRIELGKRTTVRQDRTSGRFVRADRKPGRISILVSYRPVKVRWAA